MLQSQQNIKPKTAKSKQMPGNINHIRKLKNNKNIPIKIKQLKFQTQNQLSGRKYPSTYRFNPQQSAKNNLLEMSHTDFFSLEDQIVEPDLRLKTNHAPEESSDQLNRNQKSKADGKNKKVNIWGQSFQLNRYNQYQQGNLVQQIKKLSQNLQTLSKLRKRSSNSQRNSNYHFGDRSICISIRNPVSVSNYLLTGFKKTPETTKSNYTPISQYIVRQQRNANKLRKCRSKDSANNYSMRKQKSHRTQKTGIQHSSTTQCLKSERSQSSGKIQIRRLNKKNIAFNNQHTNNRDQNTNFNKNYNNISFRNSRKTENYLS